MLLAALRGHIRRSRTLAERVTIQQEQFPLKSEEPRLLKKHTAAVNKQAADRNRSAAACCAFSLWRGRLACTPRQDSLVLF